MHLHQIKIIKSDERGTILDCGKSNFISRKKGTISADHTHIDKEFLYLVSGTVELTIEHETEIIQAPIMVEIPPNIYHKVIALTDIEIVIDRT